MPAGRPRKHQYQQLAREYTEGAMSLKTLAEAHGIPLNSIQKYSIKDEWVARRERHREKGSDDPEPDRQEQRAQLRQQLGTLRESILRELNAG